MKINQSFNVKFKNYQIERVDKFKFLGIIIDDKLSFSDHIQYLSLKISKNLGIIKKLNYLPCQILKILYQSLINSHINYGILTWGSTSKKSINSTSLLQKKAIRIVSKVPYLSNTTKLFKELNILKLTDLYSFKVAEHMFKYVKLNKSCVFFK